MKSNVHFEKYSPKIIAAIDWLNWSAFKGMRQQIIFIKYNIYYLVRMDDKLLLTLKVILSKYQILKILWIQIS